MKNAGGKRPAKYTTGKHTLEGAPIDEDNGQAALAVLELIFARVDDALAQQAEP